jgi:regulator of sirC expression with transglutaminase-like and TPR domain
MQIRCILCPAVAFAATLVAVADLLASEPRKAESPSGAAPLAEMGIDELTAKCRRSLVVITTIGRDGRQQGLGTGFFIDGSGIVASNLHVIGEARPIVVQTADGKRHPVTEVLAFDRNLDLALVKIDVAGTEPLELGDAGELKQGQSIVVLGNPQGLEFSVVAGVVSGTREIDGKKMIQLAIPIEPGNSGGPVIDRQGRVQGIVTMKSAVTENLGFAMPINALRPLIEKPNPTAMARWMTIGALDPSEWQPLMGARWRQRAGRILVEGPGGGFGGRSLCLALEAPPEPPFDLAVEIKLDKEEGAAGLVFCADGGDVHYGFYPSSGRLRLSRFDGPDVFSWQVLSEARSDHYRAGEWNRLKVRFERGNIRCFVNGQPALESRDARLHQGKVGLAKFRDTHAAFRGFRMDRQIDDDAHDPTAAARVLELVERMPRHGAADRDVLGQIAAEGSAGIAALRERARSLEREAARLHRTAREVHEQRVLAELARAVEPPDAKIDLFRAALLLAWLDNEEVDVGAYVKELDRLAREIAQGLPADASDAQKLARLNKYLFEEHGFHGSRGEYYYQPSNSYVNEVLDDREGLPITLSVLYLALAAKIDLPMAGVGLPTHFIVRYLPNQGDTLLIDVFERGATLSREQAEAIVRRNLGRPLLDEDLAPAGKREILVRMLRNLMGLAQRRQDADTLLRYLDAALVVNPALGAERFQRAVLRLGAGRREEARADVQWLFDHQPQGIDLNQVDDLRRLIERE